MVTVIMMPVVTVMVMFMVTAKVMVVIRMAALPLERVSRSKRHGGQGLRGHWNGQAQNQFIEFTLCGL